MDQLLNGLMSKVGLSESQAKKVVSYLQENADQIPGWLGEGLESVTGALGIGGSESLFEGIGDQIEDAKKRQS